jgi:hypothetical protein
MLNKITISALLIVGACAANADLIVNGQFDAPGITPIDNTWSTFDTITGWYAQSFTNVQSVNEYNPIEVGSPNIYGLSNTVGNNLELNSNGRSEVSQDIAALSGGEQLSLSFLDGYRADPNNPSTNTNVFDVLWNGSLVASYTPTSSTMSLQSLKLTAQTGTNTLSFMSTSPVESTYGGEIENVSMQAVPEPAPIAAFGLGLGILGLARRRRA